MDHSIERIDAGLQQLFPTFTANEKAKNLKTLTEKYHQYKMDYVRHLSFTPDGENPSKLTSGVDVEKREIREIVTMQEYSMVPCVFTETLWPPCSQHLLSSLTLTTNIYPFVTSSVV